MNDSREPAPRGASGIYALIKAGKSRKDIAELLDRSPSTISRELARNSGQRGYRSRQAQQRIDIWRQGAKKAGKVTDEVKSEIDLLVHQGLSPQQVVAYLARHRGISLHHETVYQLIYADKASGDMYRHLRSASKPYRKRYGS